MPGASCRTCSTCRTVGRDWLTCRLTKLPTVKICDWILKNPPPVTQSSVYSHSSASYSDLRYQPVIAHLTQAANGYKYVECAFFHLFRCRIGSHIALPPARLGVLLQQLPTRSYKYQQKTSGNREEPSYLAQYGIGLPEDFYY